MYLYTGKAKGELYIFYQKQRPLPLKMNNAKKPNFFLVGTVKGGTTALHRYLTSHPQVYVSPIKEVNYFSKDAIHPEHFSADYRHDIDIDIEKYLCGDRKHPVHIAHVTDEITYHKLFDDVNDEIAVGEMSLSYLLYDGVAEKIKSYNGDAKILMMLRNPVERAFSQYIMNLKQGKILADNFLEEIKKDAKAAPAGWGANHQYLYIGKYYKQVKNYLEVFPRDQVKILLYDDYIAAPEEILREMFTFLGVSIDVEIDSSQKYNEGGISRFSRLNYFLNQMGLIQKAKQILPYAWRGFFKDIFYTQKNMPKLEKQDRDWLIAYYRDDILALQDLIHKDLSAWLK